MRIREMQTWSANPELQKIKIRKHMRFAKCDVCVMLREARQSRNAEKIQYLKDLEQRHVLFIQAEKGEYYSRRSMAEEFGKPDECVSLIIDGADQSNYHIPYFHGASHSTMVNIFNKA